MDFSTGHFSVNCVLKTSETQTYSFGGQGHNIFKWANRQMRVNGH